MQNNIGCIHFVVVVASFSLHESFGRLLRRFGTRRSVTAARIWGLTTNYFLWHHPTIQRIQRMVIQPVKRIGYVGSGDDPTYAIKLLNDHLGS